MIYVKIENGEVVNRALFDDEIPDDWPERGSFVQSDEAQIGWSYANGAFIPPPSPPDPPSFIPQVISDRQFAHALWKSSLITFDEALAFVRTGTIPAAIAAGIAAIPDEAARQDTELLVSGAVEYRRDNAAVAALAGVLGWTDAQIDAIWTLGASL